MPTGSGAIVVHSHLENNLTNYSISPFSPKYEYLPFLMRQFSDKNADIVHTTPDYGFFHARKNQKLVVTLHNYVLDQAMIPYSSLIQRIHYKTDLRLFTKLSLEKAHTVTAVSQFVADKTKEDLGFKGEIKVIPNGVDEQLFVPEKIQSYTKKRIKVLFSGNLTKRKGAQWLMPILEKLNPNIDIVYTEGLRGGYRLPNHSRLQCLGSIPHHKMPEAYQKADILLFPTVREGFGLAAAEAMACGLPVVTTDCSALPEVVHHDKGGYLCPIGGIDEFAKRINYLASSVEMRKEMGLYNRQLIEDKFTLSQMVGTYESLFKNI